MDNTLRWMHRAEGQQVYRARFSAITAPEIKAAMVRAHSRKRKTLPGFAKVGHVPSAIGLVRDTISRPLAPFLTLCLGLSAYILDYLLSRV